MGAEDFEGGSVLADEVAEALLVGAALGAVGLDEGLEEAEA